MINVIWQFWVKIVFFEQKQFHLSKLLVFYRNKSKWYRKNLWKFELDPITFLHSTDLDAKKVIGIQYVYFKKGAYVSLTF